jgi:hypothetical protein
MTWYRSRFYFFAGVLLFAWLAIAGCGIIGADDDESKNYEIVEGPVGDLYRFCIESGADPSAYEYDVFLYWDYVNIPNPDYSYPYLSLKNSVSSGGLWSQLGFDYYEYEAIPEDSGLPSVAEPGWKVRLPAASVRFCDSCYTEDGLLRIIELYGPKDQVEFVWDPEDSLEAYVRWDRIE